MALSLRYSAVSDIGRSRKKNDDSGYAGPHFVMVADGMGGAAAGDLASAVAVQTMRRLDAPPTGDLLQALAGAVHRANDRLAELIEDDPAVEGMGTTIDAVLFDGERIGIAHLGDSRGYLWREGELLRITHDHTWVQSLIDEGRITEDEARVHSHRSLLLKVLDGRHDNDPDLTVYDVQAGDRVLLCSDGLSGFVPHEQMQTVMAIGDADAAARELLQLALDAHSTDNITVVVADVVAEPADQDAETVIVGSASESSHAGPLTRLRSWAHREDSDIDEHLLDPDIDPEELRYAPRPPRRYRWVSRGIALVLVVAIVAFLAKASYDWSQEQYYVADSNGNVAIFQGVQADLPGLRLHHVYEEQDLALSELPTYRRSQVVEGIDADSLDDARQIVSRLETFARVCAEQTARASETTPTQPTPPKPSGTKHTGGRTGGRHTANPNGHHKPGHSTHTTRSGPTTTPSTSSTTGGSGRGSSPEECAGATPRSAGTS